MTAAGVDMVRIISVRIETLREALAWIMIISEGGITVTVLEAMEEAEICPEDMIVREGATEISAEGVIVVEVDMGETVMVTATEVIAATVQMGTTREGVMVVEIHRGVWIGITIGDPTVMEVVLGTAAVATAWIVTEIPAVTLDSLETTVEITEDLAAMTACQKIW